jgi:uncharacterized protein (UPF0333 family)
MNAKAQGSLEYILLISAAIVFVIIVAVLVKNVVFAPAMNQSNSSAQNINNTISNLTGN